MKDYEELLQKGYDEGLVIKEKPLYTNTTALCRGKKIALNTRKIQNTRYKRYILSEEIWHTRVTVGDITDTSNVSNIKQEHFARKCSIADLVPIDKIVKALLNYCTTLEDMCEYLNIPEECFYEAIEYYKQRYGLYYRCKDYTLNFSPLYVYGSNISKEDEYA